MNTKKIFSTIHQIVVSQCKYSAAISFKTPKNKVATRKPCRFNCLRKVAR